jgi:hypothetical protein
MRPTVAGAVLQDIIALSELSILAPRGPHPTHDMPEKGEHKGL